MMGDDVQPTAGPPEMPKGLSRVARREFRFMCKALDALGLLTFADGSALALYCEAVAQKEKALKELNKRGAAIETFGIDKNGERVSLGIKKNPWWSVWVDACKLEKGFLIEFGLTPASRRNLKVTIKRPNPLDELINRPKIRFDDLPVSPNPRFLHPPISESKDSGTEKSGTSESKDDNKDKTGPKIPDGILRI
jgi:P27 family predicted phage terminase small subunit